MFFVVPNHYTFDRDALFLAALDKFSAVAKYFCPINLENGHWVYMNIDPENRLF